MATCPRCQRRNEMEVRGVLAVKPVGSFSLAGNGIKFSAQSLAQMACNACGWSISGYIADATFVEYPPGQTPETKQAPPGGEGH